MTVYLVKSIIDYEYGYRTVEAVCASKEVAEAYIEKNGGNYDVKFWTGHLLSYYVIEGWEVKE